MPGDDDNKIDRGDFIEFKLDQLESTLSDSFEKLSIKMDYIVDKVNKGDIAQENIKTRLTATESSVKHLKKNCDTLEKDMTNIKVSLAEKLGWTTLGGTVGGILTKYLG